MASKSTKVNEGSGTARTSHTHGGETGAIAGELASAALGSAAGPAGPVAGMVVGAAAGALVGTVLEREIVRAHLQDEKLDEQIAAAISALCPEGEVVAVATGALRASYRANVDQESPPSRSSPTSNGFLCQARRTVGT